MRGIVQPAPQWPGAELRPETSRTAVPSPQELALELSAAERRWGGDTVVTDGLGRPTSPWSI